MTTDERASLQREIAALDDDALQRMITVDQSDYREEAVAIAHEELRRRRVPELTTEQYLSSPTTQAIQATGFCPQCLAETTDESPGGATTYNFFFGTRLIGIGDPCSTCRSVVQDKYFCFLIPLVSLGTYRIKYLKGEGTFSASFVGRRLRADSQPNS